MAERDMLEAIKIQSKVVIPIAKALEAELGKDRAHKIVGDAISGAYVEYRQRRGFEVNVHPGVDVDGPSFPVQKTQVEHTDDAYGHNITGCAFADYFNSIGEPEIGALMTCRVDYAAESLMRPAWDFERTQTRMQGATHCDFRWRKRSGD